MRRFCAAALFLCVLMACAIAPQNALAARSSGIIECTQQGCTQIIQPQRVRTYRTGKKSRSVRYIRSRAAAPAASGFEHFKCGPSLVTVRATARVQLEGFCRDLYAEYKFKVAGGWSDDRPAACHEANRHRCGSGLDISQWGRSRGPGHLLPEDFPVALSERLADKWGLYPGSRWKLSPDVGHFQTKGTLYGSNWPLNKLAQVAVAASAKLLPDDPAPKRWPIAHSEITKDQSRHPQEPALAPVVVASVDVNHHVPMPEYDIDFALPFIDTWEISPFNEPNSLKPIETAPRRAFAHGMFSYHVYTDTVPHFPARLAMNYLRNVPEGTPHEEVTRAANLFGLDKAFLHALVKAESSYRPKEKTGSYIGLCQLSKYEFKRYGGGIDVKKITNARANVIVCAHKLAVEAVIFEHATNTEISAARRYMIHQQGMEGATEHYSQPDRVAVDSMCATREGQRKGRSWCVKAICLNTLPSLRAACRNITSGQFIAHWHARIDQFMVAGERAANAVRTAFVPKKKRYAHKNKKKKRIQVASR